MKLDLLIDALRQDPANQEALTQLLDLVSDNRVRYYEIGEYYSVPFKASRNKIERHVLKLVKFAGPCSRQCISKQICPGVLIFEDGSEACPYPQFSSDATRIKREDQTHDAAVTRAVLRLLSRGHKRGSVELLDGTTLELRVKPTAPEHPET